MSRKDADKKGGVAIVVTAPSGTGKTSICKEVLKMNPGLRFSASFTTRPPRPGEENGKDYYFVSEQEFHRRIAQGEFLEWVDHFGHLYGTSASNVSALRERGFDLILDLEPRGAKALKEKWSDGIFVFVLPPSLAELERRIRKRGFDTEEVIRERLDKATGEIKEVTWYDYVIFNEHLEEAIDCLRAIYIAERSRSVRQADKVRALIGS